MKLHHWQRQQGSTLITAALASGIFAILMTGFLTYLSNEYNLNYRSHGWNRSLNLAEAGIEVAYGELDYQYFQGGSGFQNSRGWINVSSGTYSNVVTNFCGTDNKVVGNFTVVISGVGNVNPIAQCVGTYTAVKSGSTISRAVRVAMKATSQFPVALLSKNTIDMNGNKIVTDSYDSSNTNKSTNGLYDANKKQANGNIASDATIIDSLNVGNANIYGVAYTGVGGTVGMGPQGSIGANFTNRDTTVAAAVADGNIESDFNVDIPDVVLPSGAATWGQVPASMTTGSGIGSLTKSGTLTPGNYRVNDVTLNNSAGGDTLTISGNGVVQLYVVGAVNMSGQGQIVITNGATLQVYIGGSVSIGGQGIVNKATAATNDQWFGLSSSTSWTVSGNGQFVGTIYAPEAAMRINGGGSSGNMSGGIVANTITLNGQVQFHYDEALKKSNTGAGYSVATWQELRLVNGTWSP